jgi:hypothetical protein
LSFGAPAWQVKLMMPTPEDLRAEATHVRALAHEIGNGYAKRVLLELAEEYEARAIALEGTASGE